MLPLRTILAPTLSTPISCLSYMHTISRPVSRIDSVGSIYLCCAPASTRSESPGPDCWSLVMPSQPAGHESAVPPADDTDQTRLRTKQNKNKKRPYAPCPDLPPCALGCEDRYRRSATSRPYASKPSLVYQFFLRARAKRKASSRLLRRAASCPVEREGPCFCRLRTVYGTPRISHPPSRAPPFRDDPQPQMAPFYAPLPTPGGAMLCARGWWRASRQSAAGDGKQIGSSEHHLAAVTAVSGKPLYIHPAIMRRGLDSRRSPTRRCMAHK